MRSLFLLVLLSCLIAKSPAQSVLGKWKVVAINNGTYYSYKDSVLSKQQFLNSLKGKKDSSESAAIFLRIVSTYEDYHIFFNDDGTFKEIQGKEDKKAAYTESGGTYETNFAHMYIELSANKRKTMYFFKFTENGIKLYHFAYGLLSHNQVSDFMLTLERSQ